GLQIRGVAAIVGNEAMPTISKAIADASKYITDHRAVIVEGVGAVNDAAHGAVAFAGVVTNLVSKFNELTGIPIPEVLRFLFEASGVVSGLPGLVRGLRELGRAPTPESEAGEFVSPG